jgi:hypothetical protein
MPLQPQLSDLPITIVSAIGEVVFAAMRMQGGKRSFFVLDDKPAKSHHIRGNSG